MKNATAIALVEAADTLGLELDLRPDYSGRSMYGRTTDALIGSQETLFQAIAQAAYEFGEKCAIDSEGKYDDARDEFIDDVGRIRMDSMGRSDLVFY